jgi:cytochrome c biogenesis protein CcmG, thiol:disulfide interchange protein DsbE
VSEAIVPGGAAAAPKVKRTGRRRHTALYTALALAVVFAAFVGVLATRKNAKDRQAASPLLGHPAPTIVGTSITDNRPFNLSSFQGRYVLVNFFASWCVPCQDEQPQLVKWEKESPSHAVVGVLFSDTPGPARSFLQANAGDWPAIADSDGQLALNYGVRAPPESYFLGSNGEVLYKFVGEVSAAGLDRLVSQAKAAGL